MKAFIFALALLPGFANAHSAVVVCKSMGMMGEIEVTFQSSGSLLDSASRMVVIADGFRNLTFITAAGLILHEGGILEVGIKELGPNDRVLVGGAQATLQLDTKQITSSVFVPAGTGKLFITQSPVNSPVTISGTYNLTDCDGVL